MRGTKRPLTHALSYHGAGLLNVENTRWGDCDKLIFDRGNLNAFYCTSLSVLAQTIGIR
jgi:hypothetical protein